MCDYNTPIWFCGEWLSAMMRIAMYGAFSGFFVPVVIMAITYLQGGVFKWPALAVAIWPTSMMLMGTMGQELTATGIVLFIVSVLLNQALYSVIWAIVGYFYFRSVVS
jgi:hypothetical protein